jgi:hypothetical protein
MVKSQLKIPDSQTKEVRNNIFSFHSYFNEIPTSAPKTISRVYQKSKSINHKGHEGFSQRTQRIEIQ